VYPNPRVNEETLADRPKGASGEVNFHRGIPRKPHLSPLDPLIYPQDWVGGGLLATCRLK